MARRWKKWHRTKKIRHKPCEWCLSIRRKKAIDRLHKKDVVETLATHAEDEYLLSRDQPW